MVESLSANKFSGMRYSLNKLPAVSEVINKKDDFGIEGYHIPTFNAALDKPRTTKFSPTKQRKTFIDFAVKEKEFLPGSTRYNTANNLLNPKKGLMTTKGKRKMFSEEIEDLAKKYKKPDPGTYEIKQKERLLGALNLKDDRTTFADEALYLGKTVVPPYDANFNQVMERSPTAKLYPIKSGVEIRKGPELHHPEPCTYDVDGSFKQS